MMKVLTIGSAMIDTIAVIGSGHIERMSMRNADSSFLLLEEGRKTEAEEVSTHIGGGAVNAAVAMARLGFDVAVLAKLGADERAATILAGLVKERVSTASIKRTEQLPTGAAVLVSSHERNAAIFTFRGANTLLQSGDLDAEAFAVDVVYVANLSNESADCFPHIVKLAKTHKALVAANPGPRQLSARGQAFFESLPAVDVLILNQGEADLLVPRLVAGGSEGGPALGVAPAENLPPLAVRGLMSGGFEMSLVAYLQALTRLGPKYVVVTDGARGAFVGSKDEIIFAAAPAVKVLSTAGAGDAFGATFAAYLALGRDAADAIAAAAINAAAVVGHVDAQTGLLGRKNLDQKIAADRGAVKRWPVQ